MLLEEDQIERLGVYFTHFNIYEQFGLTFEKYLERYSKNPSECSVEKLRREASIKGILRRTKNKKKLQRPTSLQLNHKKTSSLMKKLQL